MWYWAWLGWRPLLNGITRKECFCCWCFGALKAPSFHSTWIEQPWLIECGLLLGDHLPNPQGLFIRACDCYPTCDRQVFFQPEIQPLSGREIGDLQTQHRFCKDLEPAVVCSHLLFEARVWHEASACTSSWPVSDISKVQRGLMENALYHSPIAN